MEFSETAKILCQRILYLQLWFIFWVVMRKFDFKTKIHACMTTAFRYRKWVFTLFQTVAFPKLLFQSKWVLLHCRIIHLACSDPLLFLAWFVSGYLYQYMPAHEILKRYKLNIILLILLVAFSLVIVDYYIPVALLLFTLLFAATANRPDL